MIIDFMSYKTNHNADYQRVLELAIDDVCHGDLTIDEAMIALKSFIAHGANGYTRRTLELMCC